MLGELAALGAAFCWAIAPILYRQALFQTHPVSANIVRSATNALVMLLVLLALGKWNALSSLPLPVLGLVAASGVVGLGVADTLYMVGLRSVGVSVAVPLAASYPLFSLLWATLFLGQPVVASAVVGAVVIVAGIWLLSRDRDAASLPLKGKLALTGIAASLATAIMWSVSISLMDAAIVLSGATSLDANYAMITLRVAAIALFLSLFAPVLDKNRGFLKMKRRTIIQLCIGGLVANGAGWFLLNYSFLNIPEAVAVPISSVTPLFSAIAGFMLFHEKATLNRVLGAVVIVVGVVLIFMV